MEDQNKPLWHLFIVTFTVLLFSLTNSATAQTVPEIAEKALAATVYLEMQDSNGKTLGFGSGFFVKPNLIATNYHVIAGASSGTAKLVGKSTTYKIEGFTATDEANDLALLKISGSGINPLPIGNSDSDAFKMDETIYVAGNSKDSEGIFSEGHVLYYVHGRAGHIGKEERFGITASISPESSGGPVLNSKGEVIGVSLMTLKFGIGAFEPNLAIPSKYIRTLLVSLPSTAKPLEQDNAFVPADIYFTWGYMKYMLEDYNGAIADLTKGIILEPDNFFAYNNRGMAKNALKQYFAAITDYDTAIRLEPDFAGAYHYRGDTKSELGQYAAAIIDYNTAIRLEPDLAETYHNRGIAKANLDQYLAAIADYDVAIQLIPDFTNAYGNRGNAKANLGQYFAAISDYDQMIHLKPDYAIAYYNRGRVKYLLDQYFFAIADFDIALRLKPDYVDAYIGRGVAKDNLGQYSAAIADYNMAIQLKQDAALAYYYRGVTKASLNHTGEAKQDLQTALRIAEKTGDKNLKSIINEVLRSFK